MSHNTNRHLPSAHLRASPTLESTPEKRVRTATSSTNLARTRCQKHFTPSLLSLPDGPISLIFSFLNASDTTGFFNRPRHAFALAITNTRLLRIFGTHLARIVPDVDHGEDPFHTLNSDHMLSAIRIAGPSLRELNLPLQSGCSLFRQLPDICPQLEKIYLCEECLGRNMRSGIAYIFSLPLRSLSIKRASSRTVHLLPKAPEELSLIDVEATNDMLFALRALLRNLPRKLHLHFRTNKPLNDSLRTYLHEICPGVEEFSLKLLYWIGEVGDRSSLTRLVTLLKKPRGNVRSRCRKITLEGDVFEFLEYAHTEAHVEITRWGHTFIDRGEGIYPTRIPLEDQYLNQDVSRLTDVVIRKDVHFDPIWDKHLSGIELKHVRVESLYTRDLWHMDIQADVIEVSSKFLTDISRDAAECYDSPWYRDLYKDIVQWLCGANEVQNFDTWDIGDSRVFFASLARLIDQFPGKVIYLDPRWASAWIHVTEDFDHDDCILGALIIFMRRAVDNFEARGGDASTVRSLINSTDRAVKLY